MVVMITGGSGSGKSELAENIAAALSKGRLIYIAAMIPRGDEGRKRVERHRKMRADKGFETVERYTALAKYDFDAESTVLLECMSNLLANEM
ncbi:MAG: bifunctional adenosylcobinamide kinase/adenosylcobinamide-phosphate guanylyltransferase, partial [Clostridia bacterium]|nr:bifunctional adenosylcobinamide kinase/adenosylcobinamide-phosphate guanylyltransferase [Clostridia bacterium]